MGSIRIMSLNVRGLRDRKKEQIFFSMSKKSMSVSVAYRISIVLKLMKINMNVSGEVKHSLTPIPLTVGELLSYLTVVWMSTYMVLVKTVMVILLCWMLNMIICDLHW